MKAGNASTDDLKQALKLADAQRELNRSSFYLRSLYESARELSGLGDVEKIVETFLLDTMGTLGSTNGFVLLIDSETQQGQVVSRGLEDDDIKRLRENMPQIAEQYFAATSLENASPRMEARLVAGNGLAHDPLCPHQTKLLIQWTIDQQHSGLLGLGEKIVAEVYADEDIELLLGLTNNLMAAINSARSVDIIRQLNTALGRKNLELEEAFRQAERVEGELDRRVFHLKALYDATLELIGITETKRIAEVFLLMTLGTFSVGQGYILLLDREEKAARVIFRGIEKEKIERLAADDLEGVIIKFFETAAGKNMAPMSARQVTNKSLLNNPVLPMHAETGILFFIDDNRLGLMGLGGKITEEAYSEEEQGLLLTLVDNFMVFLAHAGSFETIQRLNVDLEKRNIELEKTIEELATTRLKIEVLERAKSHVKSVIQREMERTRRVSAIDFILILSVGLVLGLVFNFSNPGGINLIPESWSRTSPPFIDAHLAKLKYDEGTALFVDARPAEFFKQRHIQAAVNLPLALFDFVYMMKFNSLAPEKEMIVYGRNISRHYDEGVAFKLASRGHVNVKVLSGGMSAWQKKGYPLE